MEKNKIVLGKRYNRLIPIEKINKKDKRELMLMEIIV